MTPPDLRMTRTYYFTWQALGLFFTAAVGALLDGQSQAARAIGAAARARVQDSYSWSSNLACIGESLECS